MTAGDAASEPRFPGALHSPGPFPGGGPPSSWGLPRLLTTVSHQVEVRRTAELEPYHLSHASFPVLAILCAGPRSQRDLATTLAVSEQSMSTMLARLSDRGYITREVDEHNRRRRIITITAHGRATLEKVNAANTLGHDFAAKLSAEQAEQLRTLLLALLDPVFPSVPDEGASGTGFDSAQS